MPRIRSIKPEFFTSEVIASLGLSARLTFIGLWTYVDDNGVGLDNERLILAAIWPLEDDVIHAARRTREDLRSLSGAGRDGSRPGLITRYADARSRFLHITAWEEHQKVSHPRKPRYPLPSAPGLTCTDTNPPETLRRPSGNPPEPLRPEQGAGSREQGDKQLATPAAGDAPLTPAQRSKLITDAYAAIEPMCKWPAINSIILKAIRTGKWDDTEIRSAGLRLAKEGRGMTVETLRVELAGLPAGNSRGRQAQTDAQFGRAMQRAQARETR